MMNASKSDIEVLAAHLRSLERARRILQKSYEKCSSLPESFSVEDDETLETIEAFTARFAHAADILTQKVGLSIITLSREDARTFIDRLHMLEKLGAIASADTLLAIRDARNTIAHEYTDEDVQNVYMACIRLAPQLLETIDTATKYAQSLTSTD